MNEANQLQKIIGEAVTEHRHGNFKTAIELYRQALRLQPDEPDVLHFLGVAVSQSGDDNEAVRLIKKSIVVNEKNAEAHFNLAVILEKNNNISGSIEHLLRATGIDGRHSNARTKLASLYIRSNEHEAAIQQLDVLLEKKPTDQSALWLKSVASFELRRYLVCIKTLRVLFDVSQPTSEQLLLAGRSLQLIGRFSESLEAFRRASIISPLDHEIFFHMANAASEAGKILVAIEALKKCIDLKPDHLDALVNLGSLYKKTGDAVTCRSFYERCLTIDQNFYAALYNLGVLNQEEQRLPEALESYYAAIATNPGSPSAYYNCGSIYFAQKDYSSAFTHYAQALERDPNHAGAAWNIGLLRLTQGDYEQGFALYENRFKNDDFKGVYSQRVPFPLWEGETVPSSTRILVLHEQGLGDTIQFSRYLREMGLRGIDVSVLAPKPLHRLLSSIPGVTKVSHSIDLADRYDYHCHMMSLARLFRTTVTEIPFSDQPFLFADETLTKEWRSIVNLQTGQPSVGLMWSGGSASKIKGRSMTLADLEPALLPGIDFISLQKDLSEAELATLQKIGRIRHFGDQQSDFADAAALIAQVDVVVTVDTSIAHLAGALGKETWIMLPFNADWRWLEGRDDSPWYSSVRLFRQKNQNDWSAVIADVAAALRERFTAD